MTKTSNAKRTAEPALTVPAVFAGAQNQRCTRGLRTPRWIASCWCWWHLDVVEARCARRRPDWLGDGCGTPRRDV